MVERTKPSPMTAAQSRRTTTTPMPMMTAGDRLQQEERTDGGMER